MKPILLIISFLVFSINCVKISQENEVSILGSVEEDAELEVDQLLTKYGYPNEVHEVKTSDGYLLTLHRILSGKNVNTNSSKPPVLLMHGLLSSSADWVIMGPQNGLGYILADQGYDVWMGNARGNYYSRKHVSLNPDKSKFWKFSWHEIGIYDLPAMIDHVLQKTGKEQLHYIGHSQGSTAFFVMASTKLEYNKRVVLMQALAPVAYMKHLKSPVVRLLAPMANTIELASSLFGANELLPSTELNALLASVFCNENATLLPMCTNILFLISGYNSELLNTTMLPVVIAHTPAGASTRQMVHYLQEHLTFSNKFRQYDYVLQNPIKYGRLTPPEYNPKKVSAPVALHYADNDWLSAVKDVKKLYGKLAKPIGLFRVPFKKFTHLDFLWAINIKYYVYDRVLTLMKAWE